MLDAKWVGEPEPVHRAAESLGAQLVLAPLSVADGSPRHDPESLGVALVPEGRGVFPGLTVAENLRVASSEPDARAALDLFPRLGERLGQRAGTMSGGEQQMLALARAMAMRPRLLLLDEVSQGLAAPVVDVLAQSLRALVDAKRDARQMKLL